MSATETPHWFDRLTARYSRRQMLKAVAIGVTVAFVRPSPASAESAHDCQKGCLFTAHRQAASALDNCRIDAISGAVNFSILFQVGGGFFALASHLAVTIPKAACPDTAILQQKADNYGCLLPNCPGFNPKARGGPCETCPELCCPDQTVVFGYSCCTICAKSGGCCFSVTGEC